MSTRISSRARRGALALALALVAPIAVVTTTAAPSGAALPACTKTWTNTAGGSWDTAASWSGGTVPTDTDHVCITTPGTYTVTLGGAVGTLVVASLRIGSAEPGSDAQTLVVQRGVPSDVASLQATQGIEIRERGVLLLGESVSGQVSVGVGLDATIANAGRLAQVPGQDSVHMIFADVVNTGELHLEHPIFVRRDLTNDGGTIQVDHVLHVDGTMWTKAGTIDGEWAVDVHDGLRVGDAVIGEPGIRPGFSVDGGVLSFESAQPIDVTVYDDVTIEGDTASRQDISLQTQDGRDTTLTFTGTWTSRGDIDLQPAAEAGVAIVGTGPGATLVSEEELERFTPEDGPARIEADLVNRGNLRTNDGVIEVDGDVEGEGGVDVGLGRLAVTGDLALEPGSVVQTAIDGSDAGTLAVAGTATVDGLLEVTTGAAPAVGASTTLLTGAPRTGTFDEVVFGGPASYDAQYTGTSVNLVRRASESASRRFVRAAHQDFLGRQPAPQELSNLSALIDGGTLSRATLVRNLSRSPEYVTALVQRFYADTLGRPGDPDGVTFWVDQLRTGRKTVAQVAGSFYASDEYYVRAGGTGTAWVTDLYGVFFDRNPSGTDLTYWTGRITARGRTRVATELFQSFESRRQRVQRLYEDLLQRDGDPDGIDYWAGRITTAGDLALAVDLAASGEYLALAQVRYP